MRRFQFTLLGLFGLMTCVGLGCAALVQASAMWCAAVTAAVVLVLLSAVLGIVLRRWPARAFWIGFAVFGWGYLFLSFGTLVPIGSTMPYPVIGGSTRGILDAPLSWLFGVVHPAPQGLPPVYISPTLIAPPTTYTPAPIDPSLPSLAPAVSAEIQPVPPVPSPTPVFATTSPPIFPDPNTYHFFMTTGNLLGAMVFALIGGVLGRGFYGTRDREGSAPPAVVESADASPPT